MALRLTTGRTLIWRAPDVLQVGLDPDRAAVIERADRHLPTLLAEVDGRRDRAGVLRRVGRHGVDRTHAAHLLAGMLACGVVADTDAEGQPLGIEGPLWAEVCGDGTAAHAVWQTLSEECGDWLQLSHTSHPPRPGPDLVILAPDVGRDLVTASWLVGRDIPHLSLVSCDDGMIVGPLVVPGVSPCLECLELHRRDRDPQWPAVAKAWDSTTGAEPVEPVRPGRALLRSAASLVALVVAATARQDVASVLGATTRVGPDAVVVRRLWRRHPRCSCHWRLHPTTG